MARLRGAGDPDLPDHRVLRRHPGPAGRRPGLGDLVDLTLAPRPGPAGSAPPRLVLAAVLALGVDDVRAVAVVGDTANDLWSGWRAGAGVVAGVLTGAHGRAELEAAPHTHILDSVADLPAARPRPARRSARRPEPGSVGLRRSARVEPPDGDQGHGQADHGQSHGHRPAIIGASAGRTSEQCLAWPVEGGGRALASDDEGRPDVHRHLRSARSRSSRCARWP